MPISESIGDGLIPENRKYRDLMLDTIVQQQKL
mgnify:CR=1 FL=1